MTIKEIDTTGRIEAVEENSAIKISMYFNMLSKDSQPVEYELTASLPVVDVKAIPALCDEIPALAEARIYAPLKDVMNTVACACDLDILKQSEENAAVVLEGNEGLLEKLTRLQEPATDGLNGFLADLIELMGPNFVNKTDLQFETKANFSPSMK